MSRMNRLALVAALVVVVTVTGSVWWLNTNSLTAYQLCRVLYVRIEAADQALGTPGSSTADYFKQHPDALDAAHRENRKTLDSLPCSAP